MLRPAESERTIPSRLGLPAPVMRRTAPSPFTPAPEALKAITINPGEIWGVADKLGSLDVGKLANVVVASGDPLDVKTDVKQVYIGGEAVPMTSRQTRLRDQYSGK